MPQAVAKLVEERFPNLNGKVEINHIGTTIGSHTAGGTVALFFWGDKREKLSGRLCVALAPPLESGGAAACRKSGIATFSREANSVTRVRPNL